MVKGTSGYSYGLGLACFALVVAMAGATQFKVGGGNGWSVPAANAESYNDWAEKMRFQIGDTLGNQLIKFEFFATNIIPCICDEAFEVLALFNVTSRFDTFFKKITTSLASSSLQKNILIFSTYNK